MKKRLYELSLMNIIFCLMVIFIHVTSEPVTMLNKTSWQYFAAMIPWSRALFVVQGFIFLSGFKFFLKNPDNFDYKGFYLKRQRDIVLPYVLWVTIYYIYFVNHHYFDFSVKELIKYILIGNLTSHFYFIVIIVQFYLLAPFWHVIFRKFQAKYIIVFSLILNVFMEKIFSNFTYNDRIFTTYIIFWIMGCIAGQNIDKFKKMLSDNKTILILAFIVFFVSDIVLHNSAVHLMYCIFAILFVYYILSKSNRAKRLSERKFTKDLDRSTLLIYLCHCLIIYIINDNMNIKGVTDIGGRYIIRVITVYSVSIAFGIVWHKISSAIKKEGKPS